MPKDQTPKWAVYHDFNKLVAVFVNKKLAQEFADWQTEEVWSTRDSYYVEKLDVQ